MGGDRRQVDELQAQLAAISVKLEATLANQAVLTTKVAELQTTFEQAQGAIKFVKIMAAITVFLITIYGFVKEVLGGH